MLKKLHIEYLKYNLKLFFLILLFLIFTDKTYCMELSNFKLNTNSYDHFNGVVEIPAGSIDKLEYNYDTKDIVEVWEKGNRRIINYIGYPVNYGFLPKTLSGDNDPLDILVLGNQISTGSIVRVKIIGGMDFTDNGLKDYKIISILSPDNFNYKDEADKEYFNQLYYKVDRLSDLENNFRGIIDIMTIWFENYKGRGKIDFEGYLNKNETINLIKSSNKDYLKKND